MRFPAHPSALLLERTLESGKTLIFRDRETEDHPGDKGYQVNSKAGNGTRLQDPTPTYIPF